MYKDTNKKDKKMSNKRLAIIYFLTIVVGYKFFNMPFDHVFLILLGTLVIRIGFLLDEQKQLDQQ